MEMRTFIHSCTSERYGRKLTTEESLWERKRSRWLMKS